MKDIARTFLEQTDLSEEERIEGDIQLAKYLDYMGEMSESLELVKKHIPFAHDLEDKTHFKAKIRFQYVLQLKRNLVFHLCMEESESFIKEYSYQESTCWKYLYRT